MKEKRRGNRAPDIDEDIFSLVTSGSNEIPQWILEWELVFLSLPITSFSLYLWLRGGTEGETSLKKSPEQEKKEAMTRPLCATCRVRDRRGTNRGKSMWSIKRTGTNNAMEAVKLYMDLYSEVFCVVRFIFWSCCTPTPYNDNRRDNETKQFLSPWNWSSIFFTILAVYKALKENRYLAEIVW
jgi:hypothetical protein